MHCRLWASPSCLIFFFLVTFLSHRHHLALAAVLPTLSSHSESSSEDPLSSSSSSSSAAAYSVAWSSPAPGDRFGSGDTIVGEWKVTPQDQKVVSPSFRLCVGGEDGCGAAIWPEVVEESEGSYYVSLAAPSVTTESGYYLQMKDDFGHAYSSPIFNIAPTPQKKNKPATHSPPDVAQSRPDQVPMSSSPPSSSSSTGTTKSKSKSATDSDSDSDPAAAAATAPAPADPNGILSPPSGGTGTSLSPPNSAATSTPGSSNSSNGAGAGAGGNVNGSGSGPPHVTAAAHNAPPAAAIAVPLSLTGAIILLAGGLALHHRRQLAAEKARAWWSSSSSWPWNKDGRSPGLAAAERTLFTRALSRAGAPPPFRDCARDLDDDDDDDAYRRHHHHGRCLEKTALSSYPSYCYAPSSYAPEPRQRTRELGPLSREFTTTVTRPRPPSRPRAHPSSSSSPSSHRALWDRRRYTLRRSARSSSTNGGDGGGSLWRSLSFAARQKKVLPPPPPDSALNSPTTTVVTTSVTSDVLPSYLPSPRFDGGGQSVGDIGFENVPLSPALLPLPPPPPLHTRGEASDPDDLRMRELRGVYEAVARALGSTHSV